MSLWVIWQYMDQSVTKKILYGPQKYGSIWTGPSPKMTLSAMNYLLFKIYVIPVCFRLFAHSKIIVLAVISI